MVRESLSLIISKTTHRSPFSSRRCFRQQSIGTSRVMFMEAHSDNREEFVVTHDGDNNNSNKNDNDNDNNIISEQEKQFKIITCMSTSCSRKRDELGMDSLSTFGAMYSRASSSKVQVDEGACVGSCKDGPCIAIEHEDFVGSVSLEGMTDEEFSKKTYVQRILKQKSLDLVASEGEYICTCMKISNNFHLFLLGYLYTQYMIQ
jgi:hypothetical protein